MGIYDMWKKAKLEELDKTNRLSILNELDVGYRKMRHASGIFLIFSITGIGVLLAGMSATLTVELPWFDLITIIFMTFLLFLLGVILALSETSKIEAEMQKELEGN